MEGRVCQIQNQTLGQNENLKTERKGLLNKAESLPLKEIKNVKVGRLARGKSNIEKGSKPVEDISVSKSRQKTELSVEMSLLVTSSWYVLDYQIPSVSMVDFEKLSLASGGTTFLKTISSNLMEEVDRILREIVDATQKPEFDGLSDEERECSTEISQTDLPFAVKICSGGGEAKEPRAEPIFRTTPKNMSNSPDKRGCIDQLCQLLNEQKIASLALKAGDFLMENLLLEEAARVYRISGNYARLKFVESQVKHNKHFVLQKAEVLLFLERLSGFEDFLLSHNRPDLIVSLYSDTHRWDRMTRFWEYLDTSEASRLAERLAKRAIASNQESKLLSLWERLASPEIKLLAAVQFQNKDLLLELARTLQTPKYQAKIADCLADMGEGLRAEKIRRQLTQNKSSSKVSLVKNLRSLRSQGSMNIPSMQITKILDLVLDSYQIHDLESGQIQISKNQVPLSLIKLQKLLTLLAIISPQCDEASQVPSPLISKVLSRRRVLAVQGFKMFGFLSSILSDPFACSFPLHIYCRAFAALKVKDLRSAMRFRNLISEGEPLLGEDGLALLDAALASAQGQSALVLNKMAKLQQIFAISGDSEGCQYIQAAKGLKSKTQNFRAKADRLESDQRRMGQNLLAGRKGEFNVRSICVESGSLISGQGSRLCVRCRFRTLEEEIEKSNLKACQLCHLVYCVPTEVTES